MEQPNRHDWRDRAADLFKFLRGTSSPIALFLGAGASLSSGAPTLAQARRALEDRLRGRAAGRDIQHIIEDVSTAEVREALYPALSGVRPYVGYRCLSALARTRRILLLTLNWDDGIHQAARLDPSVRLDWHDLHGGTTALEALLADTSPGIACIHLHGFIGTENSRLRFGARETARFPDAASDRLAARLATMPLIVIGASLRDDQDVRQFFAELAKAGSGPTWLFSREPRDWRVNRELLGTMLARDSGLNVVDDDPSVDFDEFMVELLSVVHDKRIDDFVHAESDVRIPQASEFLLPRPDLLRSHLDDKVLVLTGDPRIGKTIIGHWLAHCRRLTSGYTELPKRGLEPELCSQMLRAAQDDVTPGILILEDPFGRGSRFEPNPGFVQGLIKEAVRRDGHSIIVTTRRTHWARATESSLPATADHLAVIDAPTREWYREVDLERLLRRYAGQSADQWVEEIRSGHLNTPARVRDRALHKGETTGDDVAMKRELLRSDRRFAFLAAIVRLHELSDEHLDAAQLCEIAGVDALGADAGCLNGMIYRQTLDERTLFTMDHQSDREAVDSELTRPGSTLDHEVTQLASRLPWIAQAQQLVHALRPDAAAPGRDTVAAIAPDRLAMLLERFGSLELLDHIDLATLDFWSLSELMREVVRLWGTHRQPAAVAIRVLNQVLGDTDRMGAYCVLEGALYAAAAEPRIWDAIRGAMWSLLDHPETAVRTLTLIFDGFLWRRPSALADVPAWLKRIAGAAEDAPELLGGLAFAYVYHHDSADLIPPDVRRRLEAIDHLTPAQLHVFAWSMRWHFLHQCRARAMCCRRRFNEANVKYLQRGTCAEPAPARQAELIRRAALQLSDCPDLVGWGVHFALNCAVTLGGAADESMAKAVVRCPPSDPGLLTAVLTYSLPTVIREEVSRKFADMSARSSLLDALAFGVKLDGVVVRHPRFHFVTNGPERLRGLDVRWRHLDQLGFPVHDPKSVIQQFDDAAVRLARTNAKLGPVVRSLMHRWRLGDWRRLDAAAAARQLDQPRGNGKRLALVSDAFHVLKWAADHELSRPPRTLYDGPTDE